MGGPGDADPCRCRSRADAELDCPPSSRRARAEQRQRPRRVAEAQARRSAARYADQAAADGLSCPRAANLLHIAPRTLRHWRRTLRTTGLQAKPRGRHMIEVTRTTRNAVLALLQITGPAVGLPALQAIFRDVPRAVLHDLLTRFRRVWRYRHFHDGFQLTWYHPGRVWAMDFTQPLHPIDGTFPYVLAIRDLASHYQLAWCPVRGEAAEDVQPVLRALFAEHGPALVLKNDNGSGFIATSTRDTLTNAGVIQLLSPPARPQYNGALERSNGVLKTYTHQHAQSAGHPFRWTSDDLEHARQLANTMSRPWGADGPTPEQAWNHRSPITHDERQTFALALAERGRPSNWAWTWPENWTARIAPGSIVWRSRTLFRTSAI